MPAGGCSRVRSFSLLFVWRGFLFLILLELLGFDVARFLYSLAWLLVGHILILIGKVLFTNLFLAHCFLFLCRIFLIFVPEGSSFYA